MTREAIAFAPASVGNVGVGFDILGHTIDGPGDRVTVRRTAAPGVRIVAVRGCEMDLPTDPARNTAGAALIALGSALSLRFGFEIEIDKGIPYGSGMGGSAASAVAALVAANALLDEPLSARALYPFALDGEAVASGSRHGDNVGAMLLGGLVLSTHDDLVAVRTPEGLTCALVHPQAVIETRTARAALDGHYELPTFVAQSAHLALLLAGCFERELAWIRRGLDDVLIEPRRQALIPGFGAVKRAALDAGALGASISGAGPSMFAWCESERVAQIVARAMQAAFAAAAVASDAWISPVAGPAAEVVSCAT